MIRVLLQARSERDHGKTTVLNVCKKALLEAGFKIEDMPFHFDQLTQFGVETIAVSRETHPAQGGGYDNG